MSMSRGSCRRLEQYSEHMLEHMLAVGSAPGCGNRPHMADVLSHVDKDTKGAVSFK